MDDREHAIAKAIYENVLELCRQQGEEIKALQLANQSLDRRHEQIAEVLRLVGELVRRAS